MSIAQVTLNGTTYPIFTNEEACDVVDQLIFAADEAGWTPAASGIDEPLDEWAEGTAILLIARTNITALVMTPAQVA